MRHAANSNGVFRYDDMMLDAVRVGSAFTGRIVNGAKYGLSRLGYLESRVIETRTVPKGHTFGYGAGYVAKDTTRVLCQLAIQTAFPWKKSAICSVRAMSCAM